MLSKQNIIIIIGLALVIAMTGLTVVRNMFCRFSSDFSYPFLSAVKGIENSAEFSAYLSKPKRELVSELLTLKKADSLNTAKFALLKDFEDENHNLRELFGLAQRPCFKCVYSEVMVRDSAQWYEKFKIDKGDDDGLKEGSVVLSKVGRDKIASGQFAVLGRITSVSNHSSIVCTLLSRECSLSVWLPESRAGGITSGGKRNGNVFKVGIKYLPRDIARRHGENVITSGLSEATPGFLLAGKLAGEKETEIKIHDNLYAEAEFEPYADMENFHFVIVLVPENDD